jgi:hypothetical protein
MAPPGGSTSEPPGDNLGKPSQDGIRGDVGQRAMKVLVHSHEARGVSALDRGLALAADGPQPVRMAVACLPCRQPGRFWLQQLTHVEQLIDLLVGGHASRYRERHGVSGAKSDTGDAHMLTDMVRTDSHQLRAVAGDSADAGAVKVVARAHKTLIWERTRQAQRLRHQLRDYFPAALAAFEDLDAPDALELLARAPDPARAGRLTRAQVSAALKRARRRDITAKATAIITALRSAQLG